MNPDPMPLPSVEGGLLAKLHAVGNLRQGEVAVTQGLAFCLSLPNAGNALDALIAKRGQRPDGPILWTSEQVRRRREQSAELVRTDLEAKWGESDQPRVVIEAKLGSALTVDQLTAIAATLTSEPTLLVALVPAYRADEAHRLLDEMLSSPVWDGAAWSSDVSTYDEVFLELEAHVGGPDLQQLKNLVEALEALDVRPFDEPDLTSSESERLDDLKMVVDRAMVPLYGGGRVWPSGSDADYSWRRYVQVHESAACFAVGVLKGLHGPATDSGWVWLRVHRDTPRAEQMLEILAAEPGFTRHARHGWLPVAVPTGTSGVRTVEMLAANLERLKAMFEDRLPLG